MSVKTSVNLFNTKLCTNSLYLSRNLNLCISHCLLLTSFRWNSWIYRLLFQTLAPFSLHENKKVNKITYFDEVVNARWQLLDLMILVNDIQSVIILKISIYVIGSTWRGTSIYWTVKWLWYFMYSIQENG